MSKIDRPTVLVAEPMFDVRVFELMERESDIRATLTGNFQQLGFLWAAEDQLSWISRNQELLANALSPELGDIRKRLMTMRSDVLFHFGNYLASVSAGLDFLYTNGKGTFSPDLIATVHSRTDRLKKSPPHRIMNALRNRQQHAPPVIDEFSIQERTHWHPDGKGTDLCPVLTDRTVIAIEDGLTQEGAARWATIKDALRTKKNWLAPLLSEHWTEVCLAFDECRAAVRDAHANEVVYYEQLRAELDDVDAKLKAMGLISLL